MSNAFFNVPDPINEPVLNYAPNSPEKLALKAQLKAFKSTELDIPMWIGGQELRTENLHRLAPPHEIAHTLGHYHKGNAQHVEMAISAALKAKNDWANMAWEDRAAIFLKAADLLATKYRPILNAATMLGQSKNAYQAEIDSACELIDFFRFNVKFMTEIYQQQPISSPRTWNRMQYRPLEGFVFALTPFNFTAIAGNLPTAPAMLGNTVVWKASNTQIYSAWQIVQILQEAGLPDGVINLVHTDGPIAGETIFKHPDFAGIHFTGGTNTFQYMWKTIGTNTPLYKTYPRIVGETGGKDFVMAHASADVKALSVALSRGAFEYQGQKCSAASRAYIPKSIWNEVQKYLLEDLASMKMGVVDDFTNFINAVIDERSFNNIANYIEDARKNKDCTIIAGGTYSKEQGYFISPTVILTTNPHYKTMCEEIFGPVLTIYVYDDQKFEETLELLNVTSPYALTGAIFAQDRQILAKMDFHLRNASGNFYINDKPTGAVVGQQPFGGARASGTNDKAGSVLNLYRWVSARSIKENFTPPTDYRYPFLSEE